MLLVHRAVGLPRASRFSGQVPGMERQRAAVIRGRLRVKVGIQARSSTSTAHATGKLLGQVQVD